VSRSQSDWVELHNRVAGGDRLALLEISRLVTDFLRRARAHDFESDWDDVIQSVLMTTVSAARNDKIRDPAALGGWVRSVTRNKLNDRLRDHLKAGPGGPLPWDEMHLSGLLAEPTPETAESDHEVRRLLDAMPTPMGEILMRVKGHGRTCEQVSRDMGIPLGTIKRKLSEAMSRMRLHYEREP
jgi:RNA polymerase sigma factor (sigma-70 family)